jgi:microcystin-dependent protein
MWTGANFCPDGWAQANGQVLPINLNQALFSLLGTTYGGDGRTTFALPDMRGRVPVSAGVQPGSPSYIPGQKGGSEVITLSVSQLPPHSHAFIVSGDNVTANSPGGNFLAQGAPYRGGAPDTVLRPSVEFAGGGQGIPRKPPYLTMNACIALVGIFPSRD